LFLPSFRVRISIFLFIGPIFGALGAHPGSFPFLLAYGIEAAALCQMAALSLFLNIGRCPEGDFPAFGFCIDAGIAFGKNHRTLFPPLS